MQDVRDLENIKLKKASNTEMDVYYDSVLIGKVAQRESSWIATLVRIAPRTGRVFPVKIVPESLASPFASQYDAVSALSRYYRSLTSHRNYTQ
jgi:hypothetical protein